MAKLADERKALPDQPGVYLFRDAAGTVVYVGKSISIKKRIAQHFTKPVGRAADMIDAVQQIDFVVTRDELEALVTEAAFIKQHRPRFNVHLRDDKSYPFIAVSLDEDFPRVYFTREKHKRGRRYFGPYSDAKRVRETLELIGKIFQYRTCEGKQPGRASGSPCLDYFIKRCQAPCVDYISREDYRCNIDRICAFLAGRYADIESELEVLMREAAQQREYEQAALQRNRLQAVRRLVARRRVSPAAIGMVDLVAVAVNDGEANAQVFQIRDGVLAERQGFYLTNEAGKSKTEVTEDFLMQFYGADGAIPPEVIVGRDFCGASDATQALAQTLTQWRGSTVKLRAAERGEKRRLFELADSNAKLALQQDRMRAERGKRGRREALEELRAALAMDAPPIRIECYDISNLGDTEVVASMVVFENAAQKKSDYRRFGLLDIEGQDDFAAMHEVLTRRMAQHQRQADFSPHDQQYDASFAALPNLIVIDGGKGQLSSAIAALKPFRDQGVTVISLAKRLEEIFVPGRSTPIVLSHDTAGLQLLQRIRNEAHRFAVEFHRLRRDRSLTSSILDTVPGVGPARKQLLIKHFRSPEAVVAATRDQLEAVPGLPSKLGREIFHHFNRSK